MMKYILPLVVSAGPVFADPFEVVETAREMFDRIPRVELVEDLSEMCGAGWQTNEYLFYCTSLNTIYHGPQFDRRPQASYEMAHLLGHALQVKHGVADVALREITRRRDEEDALRGMVTRQVECLAGVLMARSDVAFIDLAAAFEEEPFTHAHWGRQPVNAGPQVSIGVEARQEWLAIGYAAADVAACSVGEMSAQLLIDAQR